MWIRPGRSNHTEGSGSDFIVYHFVYLFWNSGLDKDVEPLSELDENVESLLYFLFCFMCNEQQWNRCADQTTDGVD